MNKKEIHDHPKDAEETLNQNSSSEEDTYTAHHQEKDTVVDLRKIEKRLPMNLRHAVRYPYAYYDR